MMSMNSVAGVSIGALALGVVPTDAERRMGRLMRAPDHMGGAAAIVTGAVAGGDGAGSGVGDAAAVGSGGADVGDAGAGAAGDGGAGASSGDGGAGGGDGASWFDGLSDDAGEGGALSDRAWMRNKGYQDLAGLVKAARGLETKIGAKGIALPKDDASAEEKAAFFSAIGRPDSAEGYDIKLPDGAELDKTLFDSFAQTAFEAGLPKSMAGTLTDWFIAQQLDANANLVQARNTEAAETLKNWGANKDANLSLANRAAARLNLSTKDIGNIQMGFGAGRTLELLRHLGEGMAEDVIVDGGGRQRFGVTAAEAREQLDAMIMDPEQAKKLMAGDKDLVARKARLEAVVAGEMDRRQGRAA